MEWLTCIRRSLEFMEEHLLDDISAQDVAAQVNMSPFFLQRGFFRHYRVRDLGIYAQPQAVSGRAGSVAIR